MKYALILTLSITFPFFLQSQVFWSEDFANGIPVEWENKELTNFGIEWSYCPDTTNYGNIAHGCPYPWEDLPNGFQTHFESNSPENGFATCVLQDFLSEIRTNPFEITLTTNAINCSAYSEVYLIFNSHIGLFYNDEKGNIQLNVSTDKINWTSHTLHENLRVAGSTIPGTKRWSKNPEKLSVDISKTAAGQETVYLQWSWTGNDEFHWSIDDIQLTTENPLPDLDISLSPTAPFHAIMPNYRTPVSQIDTAYFLTDVANLGKEIQEDVEITTRVYDESENKILYDETITITSLRDSQKMEMIQFPPYFHTDGVGDYKIVYSTNKIELDETPEDNQFEYSFIITEKEFSKYKNPESTVDLFPIEIDPITGSVEKKWAIANHFYIPNGVSYYVDEIIFEIPDRQSIQGPFSFNDPNILIKVLLYEWNDIEAPNIANQGEYNAIGEGSFSVSGSDGSSPINLKLSNNLISGDENIPLKNDQHYFIALEYNTPPPFKLFAVKANTELNYDRMIEANQLAGRNRFAAMSKIGNINDYNTFAFGGCITPHIGFTITEDAGGVATNQIFIKDGLSIFPNPSDKVSTINFDFEIKTGAVIEVINIDGRLVKTINLSARQKKLEIDCKDLPNANYLLTYKSKEAISTSRLVVLH